jgi:hypothetical protein
MPTTIWFLLSTMPFCCSEYGGAIMAINALLRTVGRELGDGELAPVVSAQRPELPPALLLRQGLKMLDGVRGGVLGGQ